MTIYFSPNADGTRIPQDARITAHDSLTVAEAAALMGLDTAEWDLSDAELVSGDFADCWIKLQSEPDLSAEYFGPFSPDQLIVQRPGQHPGGRAYWVTPYPEVLTLVGVKEVENG